MRRVFPTGRALGIDRRAFLGAAAVGTAGLVLPDWLLADPYRAWARPRRREARAVRVRGQVRAAGSGLSGVAVTDGLTVVESASDGTFELVSTTRQDFVALSVPAGYRIPQHASGTARFYHRIAADAGGEQTVRFDLERLEEGDEHHVCLLLADPQTEDLQEVAWLHEQTAPDVQATVRAIGDVHVFGIAAGDIVYNHLELFPEWERAVSLMGIPFFQVVGNHDMDYGAPVDERSTATFSRHFGPRYYSFDRGAVHYVMLDDVFWNGAEYVGYLDADQLAWLEADLHRVEGGAPVIVAVHIPIEGSQYARAGARRPDRGVAVANRDALYRLLEPFRAHILAGHMHESEHLFAHGVHEHVGGAVCGAWWSGPICGDGTPSGYVVYDVRGEEITWRYKATGRGPDHQLRVYPRGANPAAPDEIVANVWDWDPAWTVTWYEGGERRGPMARRVGRDPLSVELHAGPELPPRRTWVEPYPVGHLFYAPVPESVGAVTVEARDRFGRTYRATAAS